MLGSLLHGDRSPASWRHPKGSNYSTASEDDVGSSVSATVSDHRGNLSVAGLRDKLLRDARSERARCLEVAEAAERRRAELRGACSVATQTDPVVFAPDGSSAALPTLSVLAPTAFSDGASTDMQPSLVRNSTATCGGTWNTSDDVAQAEALRTIQLLGQRGSRLSQSRATEIEEELRAERAARQELDGQVSHERSRKEAAQQQVLCLEYELDGKEAALQVAERALDRRDAELQQAQLQVRLRQEGAAGTTSSEEIRVKALRQQLAERERQLELKDQHISRLLNVLRQHRSIFVDEDSTPMHSTDLSPRSHALAPQLMTR